MTVEAQEVVLNEANIAEEPVATGPVSETKYTFTDLTAMVYAQQTVNVRKLPSTDGNKLGRLFVNDEITVDRQCNEMEDDTVRMKRSDFPNQTTNNSIDCFMDRLR